MSGKIAVDFIKSYWSSLYQYYYYEMVYYSKDIDLIILL